MTTGLLVAPSLIGLAVLVVARPWKPSRSSARLRHPAAAPPSWGVDSFGVGRAEGLDREQPTTDRSAPSPTTKRVLVVTAATGATWVLGAGPVAAGFGLVLVGRSLAARRSRERAKAERDRAVPDLVDLFVIAAAAGHTAHGCIHAVAPRAPRSVQPTLLRASRRLRDGESVQSVLHEVGTELGPLGRSLVEALTSGVVTGAPMATNLAQVAEASREVRRSRAEEQVRRLPVTLLFPLVMCILPAFVLLAVVPLLVGSLGSLAP